MIQRRGWALSRGFLVARPAAISLDDETTRVNVAINGRSPFPDSAETPCADLSFVRRGEICISISRRVNEFPRNVRFFF